MKLLLIDTCGEIASVAVADAEAVLARETLAARSASSALLPAVARLLERQGWRLAELDAVGVATGPGSFTGVRVGLAAAKGLCCASGVMLAGVSRLEMLASCDSESVAVLDAGRGEFYVRALDGHELVCDTDALSEIAAGTPVIVAEARLLESLRELRPELRELSVDSMIAFVLRVIWSGGSDLGLIDANYVRGERDIYTRTRVSVGAAT